MKKIFNSIKKRGFIKTCMFIIFTPFYKMFRLLFFDRYLFSLKNDRGVILFYSFPDFSDNAYYLYKKYCSSNFNYKFIWLVDKIPIDLKNDNTVFIKRDSYFHSGLSLRALYYVSISSLIFYTHSSPFNGLKSKSSQLVINLWHGCGYKKSNSGDKKFIDDNYFDYVLVPGDAFIDIKSKFFGCEKDKILSLGYPRYDNFYETSKLTENFIHKYFGEKKFVVWMPTFRKTNTNDFVESNIPYEYDLPLLHSSDDLSLINEFFYNNNFYLIIKRHPYQLKYMDETKNYSNILFIDNYFLKDVSIDLYSLLKYSKGLITDYSSVAVDYLLIDKPIAFLLEDFEEYNKARGFVFENPLDYMPGHHVFNKDDLFKFFEDVVNDRDPYKSKRDKIFNQLHNKCDNYCERIVNEVDRLQKEKERGNSHEKI